MKLIYLLILLFKRKQAIKVSKPALVFWYLTFDGDQEKIKTAMRANWGLKNEKNFAKTMEGVDLNDYIICIEKDFNKYCPSSNSLIIKRPIY